MQKQYCSVSSIPGMERKSKTETVAKYELAASDIRDFIKSGEECMSITFDDKKETDRAYAIYKYAIDKYKLDVAVMSKLCSVYVINYKVAKEMPTLRSKTERTKVALASEAKSRESDNSHPFCTNGWHNIITAPDDFPEAPGFYLGWVKFPDLKFPTYKILKYLGGNRWNSRDGHVLCWAEFEKCDEDPR